MSDEQADEIGRGLELLWGRATPPSRGPKPGLSLAEIVRVAIELVDAEGLTALSMRRIAERLGSKTMSLYRHVPGKVELLDVMYDTAVGDPPARQPGAPWRTELARWARANLALHHRHNWLLEVAVRRPPVGPHQLRWLDSALSTVSGRGLEHPVMLAVVMVLEHYVRGAAQVAIGMAEMERELPQTEWAPMYSRVLRRVVTPTQYPMLAEVIASGTFERSGEGIDDFEFGLECVLDGIAARIEGKAADNSSKRVVVPPNSPLDG
jgi:AcrR family transcriptional regulator